jgi:lycopene cyclase CruA
MKEILYIEIPTPDVAAVRAWLQQQFEFKSGEKVITPDGFCLRYPKATLQTAPLSETTQKLPAELSVFVWSVQRTTYLKVFRWANQPIADERQMVQQLTKELRLQFPHRYPVPPAIAPGQSIFEALVVGAALARRSKKS